jgi:proline iminopeptidase
MKRSSFLIGVVLLLSFSLHCQKPFDSKTSNWQMTETKPRIAFKYVHNHNATPTLLIIHGGPGDNSAYLMGPCAKPLEEKYNVIWYDQRGTGKSERDLSYDAYATTSHVEDIRRVQEVVGVQQVILVAHSWGGMLAGFYAARYPEKVKAFININGTGSFLDIDHNLINYLKEFYKSDPKKMADARKVEEMPHGFLKFIRRAKLAREAGLYYKDYAKTKKEIASYLEQAVISGEYTKEEIKESDDALRMAMDYHSLDTAEIYSILPEIKASTLVIAGAYDKIVDTDSLEKYQRAIPNAKLVIFENSGHHPFQEEPDKFYSVINDFITQLH